MQNDPFPPLDLSLRALEDALQRAHARATAPHGTAAVRAAGPSSSADPADDTNPGGERLLDGADLLRAAREPIEWLLALARRVAADEPEEVAAVDRLRAAFAARLAGRAIGVRRSDVMIAFTLVVSALDRGVVVDGDSRTIGDGVATLITYEGAALATELARIADHAPVLVIHHVRRPRTERAAELAREEAHARAVPRTRAARRRQRRATRTPSTP